MASVSLKKNYFYQFVYQLIVLLVPLVVAPYISRVFGAELLGEYTYSYTIANYFVIFSALGISNYGSRAIAKVRNDETKLNIITSELLLIHLIISSLTIIIYIYCFIQTRKFGIYLAQSLWVIAALLDINWLYIGLEEIRSITIRNLFIKTISTILIFVFVKSKNDLILYTLIMASSQCAGQAIFWFDKKFRHKLVKVEISNAIKHIKPLVILFFPVVAVSLYKYMDKIMIGSMYTKAELGLYENAVKLTDVPIVLIVALGTVMIPRVSNLLANRQEETIKNYFSYSLIFTICVTVGAAFGLAAISDRLVLMLFGDEFVDSGQLTKLLCVILPFNTWANVIRTQYLIPFEKDKIYVFSIAFGAIINLVINWMLIPHMGGTGAAIGTILAEITVWIIQLLLTKDVFRWWKYFLDLIFYSLFGAIILITIEMVFDKIESNILFMCVSFGFAVIAYISLSVIYNLLMRKSEFKQFIEIFIKRKV